MIKSQDAEKAKERMLKVMQRPQNSMMQIDLSNAADKKRKRLPKKVGRTAAAAAAPAVGAT